MSSPFLSEGTEACGGHTLKALQCFAGMKYTVKVSRRGPQSFRVFLGNSHVDVVARKLSDGGLLVQVRPLPN